MALRSLSKVAAFAFLWQGCAKDIEACTQNCETEEVGLLQDIMMRARNKMKLMKPEDFQSTASCWTVSKDSSWTADGTLQCENANFYTPPAECIADGGMKLCLEECKVLCENTPSCKGIAYLADTEICYMHSTADNKEVCEHTEAWKYSCEPSCWKKEVGKTFGTDSLIACAPTGDNAVATCAADGGYSDATRGSCRQLCETTKGCVAFSFMIGGAQGDTCYLSTDDSKTEPCEGTEVWYKDCPSTTTLPTTTTTTFTKHDCWERIKDQSFSKNDALSCGDLKQGFGQGQCDADGGVSGVVTQDVCKDLCMQTFGCSGFSYVEEGAMDKCYFTMATTDSESRAGTETWYSKCPLTTTTTTTTCAICTETCDNAHILDLRYIAWSNLGCKGPNKTITISGREHKFPCEIRYWNVLNATEAEKAVYLVVTVVDTRNPNAVPGEGYPVYEPGNALMNGVTSEPLVEAQAENRPQIGGAYGQINMAAGKNATFRFQFVDANSTPIVLDKVVAQTFLDIDQPVTSRINNTKDGGGETLQACAGNRSFGYAHNYNVYWNWTQGAVPTEACFKVESSAKGGPLDNPWDPGRKDQDGVKVGLTGQQASKAWTIANYKQQSWTATFSVKPSSDPVMAGATERNLNYAFHKTSFCEENKANEVIDDDCIMRQQRGESFDADFCQDIAAKVEAAK